jgi:hypothetical protein
VVYATLVFYLASVVFLFRCAQSIFFEPIFYRKVQEYKLPVAANNQLVLDFESGLTERHDSCLSVTREGAYGYKRGMKSLAADMDLSQSELSRKLADNPNDPRNFTLDDFENYLKKSGDLNPIYYLVEKYLTDDELKQKRAVVELAKLLPHISALVKQMGTE